MRDEHRISKDRVVRHTCTLANTSAFVRRPPAVVHVRVCVHVCVEGGRGKFHVRVHCCTQDDRSRTAEVSQYSIPSSFAQSSASCRSTLLLVLRSTLFPTSTMLAGLAPGDSRCLTSDSHLEHAKNVALFVTSNTMMQPERPSHCGHASPPAPSPAERASSVAMGRKWREGQSLHAPPS